MGAADNELFTLQIWHFLNLKTTCVHFVFSIT